MSKVKTVKNLGTKDQPMKDQTKEQATKDTKKKVMHQKTSSLGVIGNDLLSNISLKNLQKYGTLSQQLTAQNSHR